MTDKEKKIKELIVFAFRILNEYKTKTFVKEWVDRANEDDDCRGLMVVYLTSKAVDFEVEGLIPEVPEEQDFILETIKYINRRKKQIKCKGVKQ